MEEGWNALLPDSYIDLLREQLNLEINTRSRRAGDVFTQVNKELFDKNKNGEWSKLFLRDTYTQAPKPKNYNMLSWDYHFRVKLRKSNTVFEKTKSLLHKTYEKFHEDNRLRAGSSGFKGFVATELGTAWSKEDTRDLLDFFDRHGIIRVQYEANGTVDWVYPTIIEGTLRQKKAKITAMLRAIKDNKSYFEKTSLDRIEAVVEEVAEVVPEVPTVAPTTPVVEPEVATADAFVQEVTQQVTPPAAGQQFGQDLSGLPLISDTELRRITNMVNLCRSENTTNGVLDREGFKNCIAQKRTRVKSYGNLSWKVREAIANAQYPASKRTFATVNIRGRTFRSIEATPDVWKFLTVDQLRANSTRSVGSVVNSNDQIFQMLCQEVLDLTYLSEDFRVGSNKIYFLTDRGIDIRNDINANIIEGIRVRLSKKPESDGYGKGWYSTHPRQSNYEKVKQQKRHVKAGKKGAKTRKRKRKY
jgi:hypothetical protein